MARAVLERTTMLLGVRALYRNGREVAGTRTAFSQSCPQFPPAAAVGGFCGGFEVRTAAGIKHLRRLQSRRVRGAQAKRLSSPARCCLQGVRTRHGISRIHHRCFGSVASSLVSRASLLQVSRNSVDQEQNERFSFLVSRNSAD